REHKRSSANFGSSAIPSSPASLLCRSQTSNVIHGSGRSWPFSTTRIRPGRSVRNQRPSGAKAIAQGVSSPRSTTSTLTVADPDGFAAACVAAGRVAAPAAGLGDGAPEPPAPAVGAAPTGVAAAAPAGLPDGVPAPVATGLAAAVAAGAAADWPGDGEGVCPPAAVVLAGEAVAAGALVLTGAAVAA